jgi:hypothetical protein
MMACPICSHTMQGVGKNEQGFRQWWCNRCGTVKTQSGDFEYFEAPRWTCLLVEAEWHQVHVELIDNLRLQKSLKHLGVIP